MLSTNRRVMTRAYRISRVVAVSIVGLGTACNEPTSLGGSRSSFAADIRGARNERITGSATASGSASWARESAVQVTIPDVGTFTGVVLAGSDLKHTISLMRSGTDLPIGSHRIGRIPNTEPTSTPMFTSGYVIRDGDRLQVFHADSGSVTIAENGQRVKGSFTVYVSRYSIMNIPTRDQIGQIIKPIATGTAPTTITGTFDAGRR